MDNRQFDNLVKSLATGATRRKVVRGIGASAATVAGTLLGRGQTEAAASHLCCTYECGQTLTTQCTRQGSCPPPPVGCYTVGGSTVGYGYFVKRCSDCVPRVLSN